MKVKTNVKAGADFSVTSTSEFKGTGATTGTFTSKVTVESSLTLP
jgi:hypothetical protein